MFYIAYNHMLVCKLVQPLLQIVTNTVNRYHILNAIHTENIKYAVWAPQVLEQLVLDRYLEY